MAQQVLDALNVRAAGYGHRGCGVSEVMRPGIWTANAGGDGLEPLVKRVDCIMAPGFIREHQIVRVVPGRACPQPALQLLHPLGPEIFKGDRRRFNGTGLAAFGAGGDVVLPSLGLLLLELLAYCDPALLKVSTPI